MVTKVEKTISDLAYGAFLDDDAPRDEKQKILDEITSEVLCNVSPNDLIEHSRDVYDATADVYAKDDHVKEGIIDELVEFMFLLSQGARVLDIGCGAGRDAIFMSVKNEDFRREQMGRIKNGMTTCQKVRVPTKNFIVRGVDKAPKMLELAKKRTNHLIRKKLLTLATAPLFFLGDMHNIDHNCFRNYDGVWSCASLFTHTPRSMLKLAMMSVSKMLKPGGIFFTSYTNGLADGNYDKLLVSSSGRIKYFSQPNPEEIAFWAKQYDMVLKSQKFDDFEINGKVLKEGLFASQFFKKM